MTIQLYNRQEIHPLCRRSESRRPTPNGRPAGRSQLRLPTAPTQVSRSASVACTVSDRWSAKIRNERRLSVTAITTAKETVDKERCRLA